MKKIANVAVGNSNALPAFHRSGVRHRFLQGPG
jgi:hypothetical protein